ncbi:hypothetical protein MPRG_62980 (plasmid) [Mycobacterium paragordonae]|uniref:Carrier domain-containing protein n=1 Tax=Mycobacterium paragordonae TaxID=1389713 RepID=A0ABQ1CFJ3_9MYCO|nr:hypothetical protein MPRG_62980 [Mycobacterium paragordonae]
MVGELYLAGPALAHGYVGQPQLSAQRFVPNPYGAPGTRMYRTGDLVRWTPQATLQCLGRADSQVKLRGQRIELGEIENALLACPHVTQAAATVHHTTTGTDHLVGYISGSPALDPTAIRQQLSNRLPTSLVPAQVVVLEDFPRTASGKLDRNALPPPVFAAAQYRPPHTPTQTIVAQTFAEVLGLDRVGLDDDFFALGGDSLLATRVSTRLQLALDTDVPVRSLFDTPTVADLANHLHRRTGRIRPPVTPLPRPERIPLSYAQQRLWFLNQFEGEAATYNMPTAFRISGALDVEALDAALDDVIARHESLRTIFPDVDGVPFQKVLPARAGMWRRGGAAVISLPEQDVAAELEALVGYRFDLSAEVPIRAQIYSVGPEQHMVGIVVHHIACDGWSLAPMVRDMGRAYRARRQRRAPQWAPLAVQYADYTLWQREWLGSETDPDSVIAGQLGYWRQQLADLPEVVSLPADRARPPVPSYRGDGVEVRIDPQLWAGVKALAAAHNATPSMVLQAVLAVLLHQVGTGDDIVIGAPIAGRLDEALDELVGFFVNTWVLRVGVDSRHRFSDVLRQVRQRALDAYSNQDVPFELLVEQLNPVRSAAHHPLFQVAMAFQNNVRPEGVTIDGVSVEELDVSTRTAKFDLDFQLGEAPTEDPAAPMAAGTVSYATDLFDRNTIERLVTRFMRVVEAVVADASVVVGQVSLLDRGERDLVVSGWSGAGVEAPVGVALELLAAAVAADADAVAVIDGARQVSYRELDEWSTRLARVLIEAGVGPQRAVGVAVNRCAELVVAWWAVVKAGGVYVPVDRAHPVERVAAVLDAVDAVCVLSCGAGSMAGAGRRPVIRLDGLDLSSRCADPITDAERVGPLSVDNTAYVIFTSGSTGIPKGVAVGHAGLLGVAAAQRALFGLDADARILMVAAPTFDLSIFEWLWAAGAGAALVVAPPQVYAGELLTCLLHQQHVSAAILTPTVLASLDRTRLAGLETLIAGAEPCPSELVAAWAPGRRMFNAYGPTEATIWATCTALLSAGQSVTIGTPIPGVCALVLDARLDPAPTGVVGELYLAGPALAHGYVGQPQLTAERFVANPYGAPGARMYRTGDLVRWTSEGTLECLGRADTQVKLRGQRIELGDIENALLACPHVTQAAATVHHSPNGGSQLVGYITLEHTTSHGSTSVQDADIVEQWQCMYDVLYGTDVAVSEFGMDFRGWNSSYTGEPIPLEEMVEWRSVLADRIMALRPRRVLEIGAGSGLVLSQIAPRCDHYVATDMSAVVIDHLARSLEELQIAWRDRVQLMTRPAHATEGLPQGYFDTIILNSVIQYFPSVGYLADLIEKVVDLLAPGGAVFIGDVRNHTLQGAFHTAVALAQTDCPTDGADIRHRVRRAMLGEAELLVAPEFFTSWAADRASVAGLDIEVKRGSGDNELNRYRYDVIIHKTPTSVRSVAAAPTWDWAGAGLSRLHTRLTSLRPAAVRVTDIPRAGLITDVHVEQALADGLSLTDALTQSTGHTAIPEELHRLGETTGYHVAVTWGAHPGTLDAVFITDPGPLTEVYLPASGGEQGAKYANVPGTITKIRVVRQWLGARLPDYMVPAQVVVLDDFPLTSSGKIDRNALPAPVFAPTPSRSPQTGTEKAVAEVFAEVLGLDQVGLDDDFFAMGGDSIVSIQVVSACRARGVWFSPRDVFECRTAARLAEVAEAAPSGQALKELPGSGVGDVPLTPIVWDLVSRGGGFDRFVQSVMVQLPAGVDRAGIVETVSAVMARHDMLRARLWRDPSQGWRMQTCEMGSVDVDALLHRAPFAADALPQDLTLLASQALDAAVDQLDPSAGSVLRMVWMDPVGMQGISDRSSRLIIVAHHLVVDAVSWRIIVFDLMRAWEQVSAGRRAVLQPAGTSMRRWAHGLQEAARRGNFDAELAGWARILDGPDPLMGPRPFDPDVDVMSTLDRVQLRLPHDVFEPVLTTLPAFFGSGVHDGLLAALAVAVAVWRSRRAAAESSVLVHLEGHGREESAVAGADLSQTVGWFTTVFPARLDVSDIDVEDVLQGGAAAGVLIKSIKEQLAAIPNRGIGYGVLRHLTPAGALPDVGHPQLMFNYLGRIAAAESSDGSRGDGGWWVAPYFTALTSTPDADMPVLSTIQIDAMVLDDEFSAQIAYPRTLLARGDVEELVELWRAVLVGLARHTQLPGAGGHTPSDFPLVSVAQDDLTTWEARYPHLVDIWPLAPLQAGLFFHALLAESFVDAYTVQTVIDIVGDVDITRLRTAAQGIIDRHDNLRTAFVTTAHGTAVQVVLAHVEVPWRDLDFTGSASPDEEFSRFTQSDRLQQFDLTTPPLLRFTLVTRGHNKSALVITHHHIVLDGWSSPLLLQEFLALYAADGDHSALPPSRPFRDYLEWVALADTEQSAQAWRHALAGSDEPTMLAPIDPARRIASVPAKHVLEYDDQHSSRMADFAGRTGVTLNTVIQLAWAIVLSHLTGRDDVVFGVTVSGRPAGLPGFDTMIGLLINTVPARVRVIPAETVTAALHRLQSEQAALIDHHHRRLSDIQHLAGPGAMFDTAIAFESYPVNTTALQQILESIDDLDLQGFTVADATHYPLSLAVSYDARLRVEFSYLTEVFDAAAVERIAGFYRHVLEAVVADASVVVGEVSLLGGGERDLVLGGWSGAGVRAPVGMVGRCWLRRWRLIRRRWR